MPVNSDTKGMETALRTQPPYIATVRGYTTEQTHTYECITLEQYSTIGLRALCM